MRSDVWRACGLALLLTAGAARAQVAVNSTVAPPGDASLQVQDGAVLLSLDEAVEVALRHNLGLIVERYTRAQARLGIQQNLGMYDTLANATATAAERTSPAISQLLASSSNRQAFNFDFSQLMPTGGRLSLGWENSREESDLAFQSFNPSFDSNLSFGLVQPLLRDFGRNIQERQLLLARSRSQVSSQEFERQVTLTIQQVVNAYWDLVEARQQLIVAQQSLGLARELHDRNRIQVEVGTMAPLELVQSEAAIATREEDIIRSQASIGDAEDVLRRLLNLPDGALWATEIRPATDPEMERVPIDLEESIQTALAERPELRAQQLQIQQAQIESRFFRNQTLPSLDFNVSYGTRGAGGNLIVRDDETGEIIRTVPGGFGDAFEQVSGFDFDGWSTALVFGFPLQNRAARAQKAIADLDLERAQTEMQDLRQAIVTEVRQAVRRVETAAKQIDAARISRQFQEKNLEAEKKRYENGMSTSFQITQIQEDLTFAKSREVTAVIAYRTALAEYQRAIGRLTESEGVTLEDPADPEPTRPWRFRLWQ
ncbi:MAG TPA: TolC family protein [Thermoanaerobaculia bacterium]